MRVRRKRFLIPFAKIVCMRLIYFYQRHISRHTCLYQPTCSQYTMIAIDRYGAFIGCLMGAWRILRCNPLSHGGYDPVPEKPWKMKWLK